MKENKPKHTPKPRKKAAPKPKFTIMSKPAPKPIPKPTPPPPKPTCSTCEYHMAMICMNPTSPYYNMHRNELRTCDEWEGK